jgi:hypothetical protein
VSLKDLQALVDNASILLPASSDRNPQSNGSDKDAVSFKRTPLDWAALHDQQPPSREWALEHWLPMHHPSILAGRGGIGKTLLAQHIGAAMALGCAYVSNVPKPVKVLIWAGEDDDAELWRRQIPICAHFGVSLADLKDKFIVQSFEGADMTLAAPTFGQLQPTPMMSELRAQVCDYGAQYVFLDNIARIYGGNENDRHSVTLFLAWLAGAVKPAGVCLLGHPAKGRGSEYSGSTAWEGACRARLYLSDRLPDAPETDESEPPDDAVRYLSRRKSNYSPNDWRRLDYRNGVLVPEARGAEPIGSYGAEYACDVVRRAVLKLKGMSLTGNTSTRSADYLPKLANQYGLLDRLSEKRFGKAMREMLSDGRLKLEIVGQYKSRNAKPGVVLT